MTPAAAAAEPETPPGSLARLNRRLAVLTALFGLVAYTGGAGFALLPALLAALALTLALFWTPDPALSARMERIWLPVALLLVARALYHVLVVRGDVVLPVVDLLLLLLAAEALRSLDARNDTRLHALAFALLLAATAYRPGVIFALAFAGYVTSATLALLVGHLRRESEGRGHPGIPVSRGLLAGTGALSALVLATSALVFLVFPRVSEGFSDRGGGGGPSIAGFSESVALGSHGSRILPNPEILLRVEFPGEAPDDPEGMYFRGRSYDRFDGIRWSRSRGLPPAAPPLAWYEDRWGGRAISQRIYAAPIEARVLFGAHPAVDVVPESRIQPALDAAGDLVYWGSGPPAYTVVSLSGRPPVPALRAAPEDGYAPAVDHYTQLPARLSPAVQALADSLVQGIPGRYDRVHRLVDWFHREFGYTTELPASARETTVEHFLFERREGHCEYFATGLVVLLRTLGIPSRVVNGFLGGRWNEMGGYLAVTGNQAHAWAEVWFPGYGWVPFDPTPSGSVGAAAGAGRMLAGRFFLDGLQHRWSKWILDYSGTRQVDLFDRAVEAFRGGETSPGGDASPGRLPLSLLFLLPVAAATAAALLLLRRRTGHVGIPTASAGFVRLRRAYARAGLSGADALPPLALLEAIRSAGLPGLPWAERAVHLYLERRFSGLPRDPAAERDLRVAVQQARRALRRRTPTRSPLPREADRPGASAPP